MVVEAVSHLVSDDNTNGTIVESIVGLGIEEWILQDAGRETNLVRRRIVVGIDGLWSHKPLVAVDGLSSFLGNVIAVPVFAASLNVVIIRL